MGAACRKPTAAAESEPNSPTSPTSPSTVKPLYSWKLRNASARRAAKRESDSYRFFADNLSDDASKEALEKCLRLWAHGSTADGILHFRQFAVAFGLKYDSQVEALCRIFDEDESDSISFREFVYGLSKFADPSVDSNVKFAFQLMDANGSGVLEEHEIVHMMRAALSSPQYGPPHNPVRQQTDNTYRCPIHAAVLDVMRSTGRNSINLSQFMLLCMRYPRLFAPAKFIYEHLQRVSDFPAAVIKALPPQAQARLLIDLSKPIPAAGKPVSSFGHLYELETTEKPRAEEAEKKRHRTASLGSSVRRMRSGSVRLTAMLDERKKSTLNGLIRDDPDKRLSPAPLSPRQSSLPAPPHPPPEQDDETKGRRPRSSSVTNF